MAQPAQYQSWKSAEVGAEPAAITSLETPIGELFVAASELGVVATGFDERGFLQNVMGIGFDAIVHGAPDEAVSRVRLAAEELKGYFAGELRRFQSNVQIASASGFGERVLSEVWKSVPFGETVTYAEMGERVGRLRAARAVGNILANCPFNIIVPCHRIVHGSLTPEERGDREGYFGSRKAWLLRFEREQTAELDRR